MVDLIGKLMVTGFIIIGSLNLLRAIGDKL